MQRSRSRAFPWTCAGILAASSTAGAQSLVANGFESPGLSDGVTALATFDPDGSGPAPLALIAGGAFRASANGLAGHLASWNGTAWTSVGGGVDGHVAALTTFDPDGAGPAASALYVAGAFASAGGVGAARIARWNGTSFSALGLGLDDWASCLAVFDDDGAGPRAEALYVGGDFEHAGTSAARGVARWNGTDFETLGSGLDGPAAALCVHEGALYVGGFFSSAGGKTASSIARWTGTAWQTLGSGFDGPVHALAVFDPDGAGPIAASLVAGGAFKASGSTTVNGVARWTGSAWAALGTGMAAPGAYPAVRALRTLTLGGTTRLYAAGIFRTAGGVAAPGGIAPEAPGGQSVLAVASWDGSAWSTLGTAAASGANDAGRALATFDHDLDGNASLLVGGHFTLAGESTASSLARWTGTAWTRVGTGQGLGAGVHALAVGPAPLPGTSTLPIVAGGAFAAAGSARANRVAQWDGAAWHPVGTGAAGSVLNGDVRALCWQGSTLFVGGSFTQIDGASANRVARWTGSGALTPLGNGTDGNVQALATFQGRVIAGGSFSSAGGVATSGVAAWDDASGTWSALAGGIGGNVRALLVFDDGNGLSLFAGGDFESAGGVEALGVARFDGTAWTALGNGLCCGGVSSLAVHGGALHAGGAFESSGGELVAGVARWSAASGLWSALGGGLSGGRPTNVLALASWSGALVAGGDFQLADGAAARHLALWNGAAWSSFGSGADATVRALLATGGSSPSLFLGGEFTVIDGRATSRFARAQ